MNPKLSSMQEGAAANMEKWQEIVMEQLDVVGEPAI